MELGTGKCTTMFVNQRLDHFDPYIPTSGGAHAPSFSQRVMVCSTLPPGKNFQTVWFYTGNEGDVFLYVNNSGLMWEHAANYGAILVFAEHRYFGESLPAGNITDPAVLQHLSAEQALEDYAYLLKTVLPKLLRYDPFEMPVISFGGSYGGMLTAWLRMRYPSVVAGGIAGSAPILDFDGLKPPVSPSFFDDILTADAGFANEGYPGCTANIAGIWPTLATIANSGNNRWMAQAAAGLKLCNLAAPASEAWAVSDWIQAAIPFLGMGSYPFPSSYMTNGIGTLPPYPLTVACQAIAAGTVPVMREGQLYGIQEYFDSVRQAIGVFYNATGAEVGCFNYKEEGNPATTLIGFLWNYIYCVSAPMVSAGSGMFPHSVYSSQGTIDYCRSAFSVESEVMAPAYRYGGNSFTATNLVFSNGAFDPWHGGGVLNSRPWQNVTAIVIKRMGHHADLMFSTRYDTPELLAARATELYEIRKWIIEFHANRARK